MTVDADEKFDAELAEFQPALLGRMNADFEDSVVFVARVLTGRSATTGARITSVDRRGVDVVTVGTEVDEQPARLDFDAPIDSPFELQAAMLGLITRARALSGEDGMTSAEREVVEMVAIRTFLAEVVEVADVHQHLRRVVVRGDDLAAFAPTAPDAFVYVLCRRRVAASRRSTRHSRGRASSRCPRPIVRSAPTTRCAGGTPGAVS